MGVPPNEARERTDDVEEVLGTSAAESFAESSDDEHNEYRPSFGRGQSALSRQGLVQTNCVVTRRGHSVHDELRNFGEVEVFDSIATPKARLLELDLWSTDASIDGPRRSDNRAVEELGNHSDSSPELAAAAGTSHELCFDDVQPFALDAEFDYDHVILTPKFAPSGR